MLYLFHVKIVPFTSSAAPLRYNGYSMKTWRNLGGRAKLASFLAAKLASFLANKLVANLVTGNHFGDFGDQFGVIGDYVDEFGTLWNVFESSRSLH
ncbi:hypothetical protein TNCV_3318711 [Trichonephila clavipes]|nr:hypothetical protein TNCV_3318711 [Trichonephila clavipes]